LQCFEDIKVFLQWGFFIAAHCTYTAPASRGVDPYGTGGTRPPNIWTGEGDIITNVPPPIFLE